MQLIKKRRTNFLEGTDKFGMPLSRDFYISYGKAFDPNATIVPDLMNLIF